VSQLTEFFEDRTCVFTIQVNFSAFAVYPKSFE
jgi:hypothetical protein